MSIETNIQRKPTYRNISWDKFTPYGFTSETEPFPYGIHQLRESNQSIIHKPINLEKESLVGYGPVVISILEDDAPVLLSLLGTLDYFFKSKEQLAKQKDFLPGSSVHAVWATCPEDLQKLHKSMVQDLNKLGYRNENINFLNIFDNSTNHKIKATELGQEVKDRKSGGREALEYIHQYLLSTGSNATLIQTFNTDKETQQKYQDSLDELAIESGTGSQHRIQDILLKDSTVLFPHAWCKKDDNFIASFLSELWNEKKIPFFNKLMGIDSIKNSNSINNPLLQVLEAFRTFVKGKTSTTKYNEIITPQHKANSAAA